jgi:hypothetical protein
VSIFVDKFTNSEIFRLTFYSFLHMMRPQLHTVYT